MSIGRKKGALTKDNETANLKPPKMPLTSFCGGYQLLDMRLPFKSDLYPVRLGWRKLIFHLRAVIIGDRFWVREWRLVSTPLSTGTHPMCFRPVKAQCMLLQC